MRLLTSLMLRHKVRLLSAALLTVLGSLVALLPALFLQRLIDEGFNFSLSHASEFKMVMQWRHFEHSLSRKFKFHYLYTYGQCFKHVHKSRYQ